MCSMFFNAEGKTFRNAFLLRHKETETEQLLWKKLSGRKLLGFRFKRQHPIQDFVVDFYCHKARLTIEIDGTYHQRSVQMEYDQKRGDTLRSLGLQELRFTDEDVINRLDDVVAQIPNALLEKQI